DTDLYVQDSDTELALVCDKLNMLFWQPEIGGESKRTTKGSINRNANSGRWQQEETQAANLEYHFVRWQQDAAVWKIFGKSEGNWRTALGSAELQEYLCVRSLSHSLSWSRQSAPQSEHS